MAGIYVHIPFCKMACHYCNFHFSTLSNYSELVSSIINEIDANQKKFNYSDISTIYFGGGTPSIIDTALLDNIIFKINNKFNISDNCEITIEANPDDISTKKMIKWKEIGFNRISLGVQSFNNKILKKLNIPQKILPEVKNSADNFGKTDKKITGVEISISAVLGDQQAAAFGQTCFEKGSIKSTYGTGAFVIMNTGPKKINSKNKLLTTICYRLNNKNTYALEGSIFIAGAGVQWLRDKVKLIKKAPETEKISKSSKVNDGVFVVPAFSGMGAPYWRPDARGVITGLTRDSDWKSIVRATVESVGYQSFDLFDSMNKDGLKPKIVKVDGGMVANNWFTQFLADIINSVSYTHLTLPTKA